MSMLWGSQGCGVSPAAAVRAVPCPATGGCPDPAAGGPARGSLVFLGFEFPRGKKDGAFLVASRET